MVVLRVQSHVEVVPPVQVAGRNQFARSQRKILVHPKSKPTGTCYRLINDKLSFEM